MKSEYYHKNQTDKGINILQDTRNFDSDAKIVEIYGEKCTVIFDTGACASVISYPTAKKLNCRTYNIQKEKEFGLLNDGVIRSSKIVICQVEYQRKKVEIEFHIVISIKKNRIYSKKMHPKIN
ncbi:hypothetical protein H311_03188 [Anncaliia algerae PRA109]|nr:hypothetical protein H311_03188 [Anncaliia algerae PRA109]